jgi:hypothetical protein
VAANCNCHWGNPNPSKVGEGEARCPFSILKLSKLSRRDQCSSPFGGIVTQVVLVIQGDFSYA